MPLDYKEGEIVYQTYGFDFNAIFAVIKGWVLTFFGAGDAFATGVTYADVGRWIGTLWNIYAVTALVLSAFFFYGWLYAFLRLKEFKAAAKKGLLDEERLWQEKYSGTKKKNTRRDDIAKHIASDNPNDWRIAIVEADIILEELLEQRGFAGNTTGDRLRNANPAMFKTLQDAWDAHRVRNKIAHEGAGFDLSQRVAQQAILQYERVFEEFGV